MTALAPQSDRLSSELPKHYMPTLEEVIRILAEKGRIAHLTLVPSKNEFQASFRETGNSGYRVEIKKDPIDAMLAAVGPRWGETWEHHLATAPKREAPKIRDVKKREKLREEQPYDDDIEDLL